VPIPDQLGPARRAVHLFVRPNLRRVSLTFVLSLAVSTAAAAEPLLLKQVVDRLGAATPGAADSTLQAIVAGVALFALVLTCRILGAAWVTTSCACFRRSGSERTSTAASTCSAVNSGSGTRRV